MIDDGIADAEVLLRPPSRIEPDGQALTKDLHPRGLVARGETQVQVVTVVLKLDAQRLVGERLEIARPVLELAIDRDGLGHGTALEFRLVGGDQRGRRRQAEIREQSLSLIHI